MSVQELALMFIGSPEYAQRIVAPPVPGIQLCKLKRFDLFVPTADPVVGEAILSSGTYEPHVTAAIERVLKPKMTFLDIGANIGYFTFLAAQLVGPSGRVLAFEPLQRNIRLLIANQEINAAKNVKIYPFGASDREGFLTLLAMGSIASSRPASFEDVTTVNALDLTYAKRIDDALEVVPDVIKVDIDGFDYPAMMGAKQALLGCKHVFAEFAPGPLEEMSKISPQEYLNLYESAGFTTVEILFHDGRVEVASYNEVAALPGRLKQTHVDLHFTR